MRNRRDTSERILAIDPATVGFGYAVLEDGSFLVDWGLKRATGPDKNRSCLQRLEELIDRFDPDRIILEDCGAKGSRRCSRVRVLCRAIRRLAARKGTVTRVVSRRTCRVAFPGTRNQDEIALLLSRRFPEVAYRLPPARRSWMSEDPRMSIFGALALACASTAGGLRNEVA